MFLSQTFFIKDNQAELLLCAHKYDFDILFFDQMSDFVMAVQSATTDALFVVDLDVLYNMQDDMQHSRKQTMFLSDLLQRLPPQHSYVYLQTERQGEIVVFHDIEDRREGLPPDDSALAATPDCDSRG